MASYRYAVVWSGREWRVLSGRAQMGHFPSRGRALALAVGLAREAIVSGHEIELSAQDEAWGFALKPLFRTPEFGAAPLLDAAPQPDAAPAREAPLPPPP